jgi:hypothetical protein
MTLPTYFLLPAKAIGLCGFFLVALMAAYWMRFSEPIWLAVL